MNNTTSNILNCEQNKSREFKRRYQCKNISRRKSKMIQDEVDTDFKVKQFLADVKKFSERTQQKQEERNAKLKASNKNQEKRGLFENGLLSKPSVKGILGCKNKARLTGNLETLLDQVDKTIQISSEEESSVGLDESINEIEEGPTIEVKVTDNPEALSTQKQCSGTVDINMCDSNGDSRIPEHKEPNIDIERKKDKFEEAFKIFESDESEVQEWVNERKDEFDFAREDILQKCRKIYINLLQKNFVESALKDEDELLNSFKNICHEYILSQKVQMVDKCEQTVIEDSDILTERSNASSIPLNNTEFHSSENLHFFDLKNKRLEEPFSFLHRHQDSENSSVKKNAPFGKKGNSIETPQIFKTNNIRSILKEDERPYIPVILSPLSPGRRYASISPGNISYINYSFPWREKKQNYFDDPSPKFKINQPFMQPLKKRPFSNCIQPSPPRSKTLLEETHSRISDENILVQKCFPSSAVQEEPFNYNSFIHTSRKRLSSSFMDFRENKDLMGAPGTSSSTQTSFSCPKKTKRMFSPHRL